jgi:integrase/recombinase XerC
MEQPSSPGGTPARFARTAQRDLLSINEQAEGLTIAAAVDLFFNDLRLAPRTK